MVSIQIPSLRVPQVPLYDLLGLNLPDFLKLVQETDLEIIQHNHFATLSNVQDALLSIYGYKSGPI